MGYRKLALLVGAILSLCPSSVAPVSAEQDACTPTSFVATSAGPVSSRSGEVLWRTEPGSRYCIIGIGEPNWVLIQKQGEPESMGWRQFNPQSYESIKDDLLLRPARERDAAKARDRDSIRQCIATLAPAMLREYREMLTRAGASLTPEAARYDPIEHALTLCER